MLSMRALAVLALLTGCVATQPATPWRVELASSGGIGGKGAGTFAVDSSGKIAVTTMTGQQCTYDATADEMALFSRLVAEAKPARWRESYIQESLCCDRIVWSLKLKQPKTNTAAQWLESSSAMPADLVALASALGSGASTDSVRVRYASRCAGATH